MSALLTPPLTPEEYEQAALEYFRTLPLEHFMEAIPQATQRKIALESLDLLHARRPDVQVFSELLVQYFFQGRLRRVVPDNMIRLHDQPPVTTGSFNTALEPAQPLMVLEWVSRNSEGKDYDECFQKYENHLSIPYCLQFNPDEQDFRLYHHNGTNYDPIRAGAHGRYAVPELDLEVGLLDGWVRFWHRGELLALPADLQHEIEELKARAEELKARAAAAEQRAQAADQRADKAEAEVARLQALLAQLQTGSRPPAAPPQGP